MPIASHEEGEIVSKRKICRGFGLQSHPVTTAVDITLYTIVLKPLSG